MLKLYIINNCCSWRNKLHSVFGNDLCVKLDPFYAIQRVLQYVPKRKGVCCTVISMREKMRESLKLFIRDPSDIGKKEK